MKQKTRKKIVALFLAVCLAIPVIPYSNAAKEVQAAYSTVTETVAQVGDTNRDGSIDSQELVRVKKATAPLNKAMQIHMEYQKEEPAHIVTNNVYTGGKMVFEAYVPEGITGGTGWWGVAPTKTQDTSIYTCAGANSLYNEEKVGDWAQYEVEIPSDGDYYLAIAGATGTQSDWVGKQLLIDNVKIYDTEGNLIAEDNFDNGFTNGLFKVNEIGKNHETGEEKTVVELYTRPESEELINNADLNGDGVVNKKDGKLMRKYLVDEIYSFYKADTGSVNNDTLKYQVTDELERELDDKKAKAGKKVGIRYFLHLGAEENNALYSVSDILDRDSTAYESSAMWEAAGGGAVGTKHWWGKSLFGYYSSMDKWVVERDVQMLTDAGIDFLAIDTTNGVYTEQLTLLLEVLNKYYDQGFNVPKVTFTTDVASSVSSLKDTYSHLWYDAETTGDIENLSTVQVAKSMGEAMSASAFYGDETNRSRNHNGKKEKSEDGAVRKGYHFEYEFDTAIENGASTILIENWNEWLAERKDGTESEPIVLEENADMENSSDIQPMDGGYGDDYYMQLIDCIREFKGNTITNNQLNTAAITENITIDLNGDLKQWNKVSTHYLDYTDEIGNRDAEGYDRVRFDSQAAINIDDLDDSSDNYRNFITKNAYAGGSKISFDAYIPELSNGSSWFAVNWTTDVANGDIYACTQGKGAYKGVDASHIGWQHYEVDIATADGNNYYIYITGACSEWGAPLLIDNVKITSNGVTVTDSFDTGLNTGLFNTGTAVSKHSTAVSRNQAMEIQMEYQHEAPVTVITDKTYQGGKVTFEAFVPKEITGGTGWWGVAPTTNSNVDIYAIASGYSLNDPAKQGQWAQYEMTIPDDGQSYYLAIGGATGPNSDWAGKQLLIDNFKIYDTNGNLVEEDNFNHSLLDGIFRISETGKNHANGQTISTPVKLYDRTTKYTDATGRNDINRMKMTSDGVNLYALVETANDIQGFGQANCMSLFISTGNVGGCWNQYEYVVNRDSSMAQDGKVIVEKYAGGAWKTVGTATYCLSGNTMQLAIPLETIGCDQVCDLEFKWADNYSEEDIYSFYTKGDTAPYGRLNYVFEYKINDGYAAINVDNINDRWSDGDKNHINFVTANKYPGGSVISFDALYPTGGTWWRVSYTTDITNANIWNDPYFYMQNDSQRDRWSNYTITLPQGDDSYYIYICGAIGEWGGNQLLIDNFMIEEPSGKVTKETFNAGYGIFNVSEANYNDQVAVEWKTKESASTEQSNQSAELHFLNFDGGAGRWDFITADAYPTGTRFVFDAFIPTGTNNSWWGALTTNTPSTTSIYDCAASGNGLPSTPTDQWFTIERTATADGQYFAIGGPQEEWKDANVFVDNFKIYDADGKLIAKDDFRAGLHQGIFDVDELGEEKQQTTVSLGTPTDGIAVTDAFENGALAVSTETGQTTHMSNGKYPQGSIVTFDAYVPNGLEWWGVDAIEDRNDTYIYSDNSYGNATCVWNQNPYYYGEWASYTWTLNATGYIAFEANWNGCGNLLIDNIVVKSPEGKILVKDDFDNYPIEESMFDVLDSTKAYLVEVEEKEPAVLFTVYDPPTINGSTSGDAYAIVDEAYRQAAEAGFNKLLALREGYTSVEQASNAVGSDVYEQVKWRSAILEDAVVTSLELAEKHGLQYYVKDWSFYGLGQTNAHGDAATLDAELVNTETQFATIIGDMFDSTNPYINHSTYAGNYALDEPLDNTTDFQALAWQAKYYNQVMADKKGELYVNLLPAYGSQDNRNLWDKIFGGSTDYKYESTYVTSYLNKYLNVARAADSKINYICWDYYPLMTSGHDDKKMREENYLYNFNVMAQAAMGEVDNPDDDLELRFTLQATGESDYGLRTINSAADLKFQIYTGMAFGVNDFTYYKYSGTNGEGIFDYITGETNETVLGYAKEVNSEVHAIENWFADYKWHSIMAKQGTYTTEMSDNMINGMQLSNSNRIVHDKISSVTATQDTIAGVFEAKDPSATTRQHGYMFVNIADPAEGKTDTVTINFADGVKGVCVCKDGKQEIVSVSGNYTFTLEAGAGAFIVPIQ